MLKKRLISTPIGQAMMTIKGVTKSAICMLLPTATPNAKSILFLRAQVTAVKCSAALPTIGMRIRPTKVSLMCHTLVTSSIAETKNSAQTPTMTVTTINLIQHDEQFCDTLPRLGNSQSNRHPGR